MAGRGAHSLIIDIGDKRLDVGGSGSGGGDEEGWILNIY